jgi:hypothetical protein
MIASAAQARSVPEVLFFLLSLFFMVLFAIFIFLAIREMVCWYWKTDQLVRLQKKQLASLQDIRQELAGLNTAVTLSRRIEPAGPTQADASWPGAQTAQDEDPDTV